jgi:hypothetical protein
MISMPIAPLLRTVDTAHGLRVFAAAMLLALTIGQLRRGTPALQKARHRK